MVKYTYGTDGKAKETPSKRADLSNLDRQVVPEGTGQDTVDFWRAELGRYEVEFKPWADKCNKILRRYRDTRDDATQFQVRYNILWSNIQVLHPAVFSQNPQPVVERRYLDSDPIGRVASQTLERATETNNEQADFAAAGDKGVDDYLLCGRGQMWCRYEPEYRDAVAQITVVPEEPPATENTPAEMVEDEATDTEPDQEVAWEKVCIDYVYWADFAHAAARSWPEVWWVARRSWLSREEGVARFGPIFKKIALKKPEDSNSPLTFNDRNRAPKAEVWEIWDRTTREVFFVAPDMPQEILERVPDPLHLQGFFPCPKPLYATLTNDSLVPVPDYVLYQDQAQEIDSLTNRISRLTAAVKVAGLYAGDATELGRLLSVSVDNQMIAVDNWAAFAERGGLEGSLSWLPAEMFAKVLVQLYDTRERAKRDLDEVTGISDIIRGQSSGTQKTATEQRIKGNFASLRLDSRRKEVARFMRDIVAIVGEIIAEHFSAETLAQMTGMLPVIEDEVKSALASSPPPTPAAPPQGGVPGQGNAGGPVSVVGAGPQQPSQLPPGAGPSAGGMGGGGMQQMALTTPPQPPPPDPKQIALQVFQKALELLKNDKMRTFRIDIETDSTVDADAVMGKEEVAEFMGAIAQFLNGVLPVLQAAPALLPAMVAALKYAMRRFRMGREVETAFDAALDQMEQATKNPQPPPPDPALQLEQEKGKIQIAGIQAQAQVDQQKMAAEAQLDQQRIQIKQQELELDRQRLQMESVAAAEKHRMDMERMQMQAAMAAQKASQPTTEKAA